MNETITIPQIFFTHNALQEMVSGAQSCRDTETGGLLLGKICHYETGRAFVVTTASGAGPKARLSSHGFSPDIEHYKKIRRQHPSLRYLGEWHKHPNGYTSWTNQDLTQALEIFANESVEELLCPICTGVSMEKGVSRIEVRCFYINSVLSTFLPVTYAMIPEPEDHQVALRYLAVEEDLVRAFIASRKAFTVVEGDIYPKEGVAHLFSSPFLSNQPVVLINGRRCSELSIAEGHRIAAVIRSSNKKSYQIRGYELDSGETREIETEIVSPKSDVQSRNQSMLETRLLQDKHIAIIGLGSIGSVAAVELARAGAGKFTLIDPDTVRIQNLCRHVCDLTDLGMTKVSAVERRIHRILPSAKVCTHAMDVNLAPDKTLEICSEADILLVTTDTENSRRLSNWVAHQLNIPVIFAGLLERAVGGRVWRVVPGISACYECYPGSQEIQDKGPVSYSEAKSPRDLTIQPGLGNDISFVTHLAVRYAIDTLSGAGEIPYPILFWFNHASKKWSAEALTLYKVEQLPPSPCCPYCSETVKKEDAR